MTSAARIKMAIILDDVKTLTDAGYRLPDGPAVRAALITLCTAWETYIENLVRESIAAILAVPGTTPGDLPDGLKNAISEKFAVEKPSERWDAWELAGDGWKALVLKYVELRLDYWNTPSPGKIDDLFRRLLGIRDLLSRCTWQNMTSEKVVKNLNEFIKIRGEAVHVATTPGSLNASGVREWVNYFVRLADRMDQMIGAELAQRYEIVLNGD